MVTPEEFPDPCIQLKDGNLQDPETPEDDDRKDQDSSPIVEDMDDEGKIGEEPVDTGERFSEEQIQQMLNFQKEDVYEFIRTERLNSFLYYLLSEDDGISLDNVLPFLKNSRPDMLRLNSEQLSALNAMVSSHPAISPTLKANINSDLLTSLKSPEYWEGVVYALNKFSLESLILTGDVLKTQILDQNKVIHEVATTVKSLASELDNRGQVIKSMVEQFNGIKQSIETAIGQKASTTRKEALKSISVSSLKQLPISAPVKKPGLSASSSSSQHGDAVSRKIQSVGGVTLKDINRAGELLKRPDLTDGMFKGIAQHIAIPEDLTLFLMTQRVKKRSEIGDNLENCSSPEDFADILDGYRKLQRKVHQMKHK